MYKPKFVYSSAETLQPFMRELIEEVFGCKVYDFYGSREVGAIAGECSHGKMHIFSFNNLVEVVDFSGNPVAPGEEGRVIITTLHNYSMPLIRYDIGDTARLGEAPCSCGSPLPVIEEITGRITDHFLTRDGGLVHGEYFSHLFYFKRWVAEFQVVQEDFDLIKIYFVKNLNFTPPSQDIEDIEKKIRLVMGEDCKIEWIEVKVIPPTPQGKRLFTRSLLWEALE